MKKFLLLLIVITVTSINIFGQTIPQQISYQGVLRLANGNIVGDGNYQLTFKIYNTQSGGTALWTEAQTVMVTNGVFSANLGSITPITGVPFNRDHYLGITIAAEPELSPRTKLTPTPYSFMAMDIMNNTVTSAKIVDGAIVTADLGDNSVTSAKIVDETITGADIANSTIGPEKLNFTPGTGTIGGSGAANYIPRFTAATTLGNSAIYQSGTNIGIGTSAPAAKLEVDGTISISGSNSNELNRTQTGDANLVPIAYANINSNGTVNSIATTSNVTLYSHSSTGVYFFTISGVSVTNTNIVCIATLIYDSGTINWGSDAGRLIIGTRNSTGGFADRPFNFIIYRK